MSDEREWVALLPCPFCDDPMEGSVTDHEAGFARGPYDSLMVQCDNPGCATLGPSSQTMQGAIDRWNTRADAALAEIGAVRVKPEGRHRDTERNRLLSQTVSDLFKIIENHDPEVDIPIASGVWDRLDKLSVDVEARILAAIEPAPVTKNRPPASADWMDGPGTGPAPVSVRECPLGDDCDLTTAYMAGRGSVSVREAALKAQIHRLTAAGDSLTAWVDDRGTPDVRKWDKARDEAFRAIAEGKE